MGRFRAPEDAQRASHVQEREIEWLIEGRIPRGMVTLIAGRQGEGKSLLSAWLAAKVSHQGGVIFSNDEDLKAQTSRPRLRLAGADLNRVHFWKPELTSPDGIAQLETFVRHGKVRLLVVDPVSSHFPHQSKDDRAVIARVAAMCERTGLAVVALDHTRKTVAKNAHPAEAILGASSGFAAAARFVYVFGANPNDPDERVLAGVKTNVSEVGAMAFSFEVCELEIDGKPSQRPRLVLVEEQSKVTAHDVVQYRGSGDVAGGNVVKKAVAAEWLTSLLMFGALPVKDVQKQAEDTGISWATVRRSADEIEIEKARVGYGKGGFWTWALPAGHPALVVGQAAASAAASGLDDGEELTVERLLEMIDAGGDDE